MMDDGSWMKGGLKWKIVGHGKCKCKKDDGWWILDERRTRRMMYDGWWMMDEKSIWNIKKGIVII
jgi:hypothetical protein